MENQLPADPYMLLGFVNTKLRDEYSSFDELCRSLDLDSDEIVEKLRKAGFEYQPQVNQFR